MKKIILSILPALALVCAAGVSAETGEASVKIRQEINTRSQVNISTSAGVRETVREQVKIRQEEIKDKVASRVSELKNRLARRVLIKAVEVTGVTASAVTVSYEGKSVTVNIGEETKIVRRFFGIAEIGDIQVGHKVAVVGLWTDETETAIDARLVRDLSIQKRFGVFVGEVTAISGSKLTLETVHRGTQTVEISETTKIVDRKMMPITEGDLEIGHRVRVKGTWDSAANFVTEVTQVKDYTIPEIRNTPVPGI